MKREVSLFKDNRYGFSAKNIIALLRSLGYTDEQIKAEMIKIKSSTRAREVDSSADCENDAHNQ